MKRVLFLLFLTACVSGISPGEFFDDFYYENVNDTLLMQNGWNAVHGINAPPAGALYSRDLISFERLKPGSDNRTMNLRARTRGERSGMELSRMEAPPFFREGTYAAQVFFDHGLRKTRDGNIQTFYLISPSHLPVDSSYSECDIEYLPYNVWSTSDDTRSAVYFNTWETYLTDPFRPDHASSMLQSNFRGWHLLIIRVMNGTVTYFLDKSEHPAASHQYSPSGSTVYPESPMHLSFANWITSTSADFPDRRESEFKIDWVYHAADTSLDHIEIRRRVNAFRKAGTVFVNDLF